MNKVKIIKNEAECSYEGRMPVKRMLERTSIRNRHLADYMKERRGWLTSDKEIDLLKQLWSYTQKDTPIVFENKQISYEKAKEKLSVKAQQHLISVTMASENELSRKISYCLDDNFSAFDHLTKKFPNGILDVVKHTLEEQAIGYEIIDNRKIPEPSFSWKLSDIELRPAQKELDKAMEDHDHGAIWWAMGTGKSLGMVQAMVKRQVKTIVAVPFVNLLGQMKDEILKFSNIKESEIGLQGGGHHESKPVTIVTYDSLTRNIDELKKYNFGQVLVDEAHFTGAYHLYDSIMKLPAYYRYFYSGTLYREKHPGLEHGKLDMYGENMLLKAICKQVIHKQTYIDGVKEGYLAPIKVKEVDSGAKLQQCGYHKAREIGIIKCRERNNNFAKEIAKEVGQGNTILALVIEKEHVDELEKALSIYDLRIDKLTGDTPIDDRDAIKRRLNDRELDVVIGTPCVRYGLNVTTLDGVANVGGLKGARATLQGTSRPNRKGKHYNQENVLYNKEVGFILDSMDRHHPRLEKHALERMKAYADEGFDVPHLEEYLEEQELMREGERIRRDQQRKSRLKSRLGRLPKLKQDRIKLLKAIDDPNDHFFKGTPLKSIKEQLKRVEREIKSLERFKEHEERRLGIGERETEEKEKLWKH